MHSTLSSNWLKTLPIAHRGLHDSDKPENSLGAFRAAAANGYAIELDIHCTADDKLVVFHDDLTERLTGERYEVIRTQASALCELSLLGSNYRIPLLSEVFEDVQGKVPILIEVKTGTPSARIGPILVKLINGYGGRVAVQSFDPGIISWLCHYAPNITRGQLSCGFTGESTAPIKKFLLKNMLFNARSRPDFIGYGITDMPSLAVRGWLLMLNVPLLLWTVKSTDDQKIAESYGANIIFEGFKPLLG